MSDISLSLRSVISRSWDNGDYSGAIREAFFYLSELIRDKGDCEGDGQQLITAAFGGVNPKIRINNLTSDSDRSEQEGFVLLMRGIYLTIRNPRSHAQTNDSSTAAYRFLVFMDWLLEIIQGSRGTYGQDEFIGAVMDPDFVNSEEYAQALLNRIPKRKRKDFLLSLYRNGQKLKTEILATIFHCYYKQATDQDTQGLVEVFSDELRSTRDDTVRKVIIYLLTPQMWRKLDRVAQMRTENKILASLSEGATSAEGKLKAGWMATWSGHLLPFFDSPSQVLRAVGFKVLSRNPDEIKYVGRFLTKDLWALFTAERVEAMKKRDDDIFFSPEEFPLDLLSQIREGKRVYYNLVASNRHVMPEHLWNMFHEAMSSFSEKEIPETQNVSDFEDDIPF